MAVKYIMNEEAAKGLIIRATLDNVEMSAFNKLDYYLPNFLKSKVDTMVIRDVDDEVSHKAWQAVNRSVSIDCQYISCLTLRDE